MHWEINIKHKAHEVFSLSTQGKTLNTKTRRFITKDTRETGCLVGFSL